MSNWRRAAACQRADPDLFFPVSASGRSLEQVTEAKAICGLCAVRRPCLEYALATRQAYGVWGGQTEDERRLILRRRPPAAPASGTSAGPG